MLDRDNPTSIAALPAKYLAFRHAKYSTYVELIAGLRLLFFSVMERARPEAEPPESHQCPGYPQM